MNLARIGPRASLGAAVGALAAFLGVQLGLLNVLGVYQEVTFIVVLALGGAAAALIADRSRWILRVTTVVMALLSATYLFVAWTPFVRSFSERWVRVDPVGSPTAVIVLSSGMLTNGAIDAEAIARLLTGAEIARTHAARIVTTRIRNGDGMTSDADQHRIISQMAPNVPWTIVSGVHDTHDEAVQSAKALLPIGASNVVVATSPMHTRRACATFEAVGFHVTCVAALERARDTWHPQSPDDRLASFRDYLYERLGWIKYRTRGWVH